MHLLLLFGGAVALSSATCSEGVKLRHHQEQQQALVQESSNSLGANTRPSSFGDGRVFVSKVQNKCRDSPFTYTDGKIPDPQTCPSGTVQWYAKLDQNAIYCPNGPNPNYQACREGCGLWSRDTPDGAAKCAFTSAKMPSGSADTSSLYFDCPYTTPYQPIKLRMCVAGAYAPSACTPGSMPDFNPNRYYTMEAIQEDGKGVTGQYLGFSIISRQTGMQSWFLNSGGETAAHFFPQSEVALSNYALQWRFEPVPDRFRLYRMVNRRTGYSLNFYQAGLQWPNMGIATYFTSPNYLAHLTPSSSNLMFDACDSNGNVEMLNMDGPGGSLVFVVGPSGTYPAWGLSNTLEPWPDRYHPGYCEGPCSSGWTEIDSGMDGLFCRYYVCEKSTPLNVLPSKLKFRIVEVTEAESPEFPGVVIPTVTPVDKYVMLISAAVKFGFNAGANKIATSYALVAGEIVQKFGKVGMMASAGLGVLGMALSMLITATQPTVQEQLQELENRIMEQMNKVVTDADAENSVREAVNSFAAWRATLHVEIPAEKARIFSRPDTPDSDDITAKTKEQEIDDLSNRLNAESNDAFQILAGMLPRNFDASVSSDPIPTTDVNVKLVQKAFKAYYLNVLDVLAVKQESILLDSYVNNDAPCDTLMSAAGYVEAVERQRMILGRLQDVVIRARIAKTQATSGTVKDSYFAGTTLFLGDASDASGRLAIYQNEIKNGMANGAYSYEILRDFSQDLITRTRDFCTKLQPGKVENSATREEFATCAQAGGQNCK